MFILEEFRKKQKKSNMSDNLQYFMETSYKATGSDTFKVTISHACYNTFAGRLLCLMSGFCISLSVFLHGPKCTKNDLFLLSGSLRSRGTIQGGSPGINRTNLRSQSRSQSLFSQRRSSSNSRKSTLAGSMRRIIKMHRGIKDRDCIHCGDAESCFAEYTGVPVQNYTLQPS